MRTGEAEERGTNLPPSAASGAACTSSCCALPKVSLFQMPDRPNRPEIGGHILPAFAWDARIRSLCSPAMVIRYPVRTDTHTHARTNTHAFIFSPTFQLVELDLGWCKPAHPLQRCVYYGTITKERQPRPHLKMHKSPDLTTVTARK